MPYREPTKEETEAAKSEATRRVFPTREKLRVVSELLDAQKGGDGAVGAFLRREGLTSGTVYRWKKEWETGALSSDKKERRGPLKAPVNPLQKSLDDANKRIKELEALVQKSDLQIRKKDLQIEFQKKIFAVVAAWEEPREMPSVL